MRRLIARWDGELALPQRLASQVRTSWKGKPGRWELIRGTERESGEKRSSPAARLHEACCEPIPWLLRAMGLMHIRLPNREEEAWCTTGYDHRDAIVRFANPAGGKIHSKRCQILLPIMVWALPSPLLILVLAVVAGSASA